MRRCLICLLWLVSALPGWSAPVVYTVSPGPQQSVRFEARTQTEHYGGRTDQVSGQIQVDPAQPARAPAARLVVGLASLTTGNGTRDSHMRHSFLETNLFPEAVFVLARLSASGALVPGKPVGGQVEGTFTLHGVTRTIQAPVTVTRVLQPSGQDSLHVQTRFVVRLADYGIGTPRFLFFSVRPEHPVTVDVWAVRGTAPKGNR